MLLPQGLGKLFKNAGRGGRETDMPGFRRHATKVLAVGPVKAESVQVLFKPGLQLPAGAVCREFLRDQFDPVAASDGAGIENVEVRAPVMAAGAGQCRVAQNGVTARCRGQFGSPDRLGVRTAQPLIATELSVPDGQLPIEVPVAADDPDRNAIVERGREECLKWRGGFRLALNETENRIPDFL